LLIDGQDWAELIELKPKKAADAQKFAQQVNLAARLAQRAAGSSGISPYVSQGETATDDDPALAIDQLERLAKLRADGLLSDEEFEEQKQRVLKR
jgi:Short C-terminal domain